MIEVQTSGMKYKVAVIDKNPSRNDYSKYFSFDFDLFHMSSEPVQKLLKKDVDIEIDIDYYDFVITVGAEATKHFAKVGVSNFAGILVEGKFLPMSNPAMFIFKPEGKPEFERSVAKITKFVTGELTDVAKTGDFKGIECEKEAFDYLMEVLYWQDVIPVAIDCETTNLAPRNGHMLGLSLSHKINQGRYISADCMDEVNTNLLQMIVDKHTMVFHNRKFDEKWFRYHLGIKFQANCHDTMVMHYCLDETPGSHGLKVLALKHTSFGQYDQALEDFKTTYCATNGIKKEDFTYDLIPFDIMYLYAAMDTAVTLEIFMKFWPIISKHPKLSKLYTEIMIPATLFLTNMEERGIPISKARMVGASTYLDEEILTAKEKVFSFDAVKRFEQDTGKIFNPNSVQQLRTVLFTYLGLNPVPGKITKTGAISTDAEVLKILAEQHPLPAAILIVRKLSKIKNTYVSKILPSLDRDGRIRTNFNLIFTTSGRLSSSGKFNAQQIPRDDPIIKGCIVANEGYKIISQDLSTAEVYYAAVLSGDKKMQGIFLTGGDFHSSCAKLVFNLECPVDMVKKLYPTLRQAAKAVTFGILYGSGAKSVSETVTKAILEGAKEAGIEATETFTVQDAQDAIDDYFATFHVLKAWLDLQKKIIKTDGFVYTFFNRKRRLANVFSPDKGIAAHEIRSGINALIQSLASDMNLLAAMETQAQIDFEGLDAHIFMLVHDSIVIHCKDEHVERVLAILKECTQRDRGCSIPGFPVGIDQEVHEDYSFGKFEKKYELREDGALQLVKDTNTSNATNWVINTDIDEDDEEEVQE